MPIYIFRAFNKEGTEQQGEVQAIDKAAALDYLRRDNLIPLYLEERGARRSISLSSSLFGGSINIQDKVFLTRHLSAILRSGINLLEALEILEEDAQKSVIQKVLKDAKINLERGQPLSDTFASYPKHFSPVFVGLVKSGEMSGTLEDSLANLGEQLQREYDIRKKIQSAMIYPVILLFAASLIIVLLLTFVMPRMMKALVQAKIQLPLITRIMLYASDIFSANPLATISVFLSFIVFLFVVFQSKLGRRITFIFIEKLPLVGNLIKKFTLSRFALTFRNLLRSGMPAIEALDITAKTVGNFEYERALLAINFELQRGASLHEVFEKRSELFPQMVTRVIAVGERTGTLENSLLMISNYYNEEVERVLKNLVTLLEPILLVIMGVIIASIALSILLPIYQLMSSFH